MLCKCKESSDPSKIAATKAGEQVWLKAWKSQNELEKPINSCFLKRNIKQSFNGFCDCFNKDSKFLFMKFSLYKPRK